MKVYLKCLLPFISIILLSSCSQKHEEEDKIITDLNEVFDPLHEGETDWNYTEIDEDWLEETGLYYDYKVKAYRQKQSTQKEIKKNKPMNPITTFIILSVIFFLSFECWLLHATYQIAFSKHRICWIWLFNSLVGGIGTFIVLALSRELKHDKDLGLREEPDLLGITIAAGNATLLVILVLFYRLYLIIESNPSVLRDF